MQNQFRLPGIEFDSQPVKVAEALPRMDIPAFVGFAEKGPVNVPVPVENTHQFREIFGDDVALAWDAALSQIQYNYLGASVEAFFGNGGKRCWIVRVAGNTIEQANFSLTGLVPVHNNSASMVDGEYEAAKARARSGGAWVDNISVNAVLTKDRVNLFSDEDVIDYDQVFYLEGKSSTFYLELPYTTEVISPGDLLLLSCLSNGPLVFLFVQEVVREDALLKIKMGKTFWGEYQNIISSPDINGEDQQQIVLTDQNTGLNAFAQWSTASSPQAERLMLIERLSMSLVLRKNAIIYQRLTNLGFCNLHARFWAHLPSDEILYRVKEGQSVAELTGNIKRLYSDVASPRFDLAGPADQASHYLPINLPENDDVEKAVKPQFLTNFSARSRNGLLSLDLDAFLDDQLKGLTTYSLINEAEYKYYQENKILKGFHSLLPVDEVTLVSVPDSYHKRWTLDAESVPPQLTAPTLEDVKRMASYNELSWNPINSANQYRVQSSSSSDFEYPTDHVVTIPTREENNYLLSDIAVLRNSLRIAIADRCAETLYFRVRAERFGEVSAWSNNVASEIPKNNYFECQAPSPGLLSIELNLSKVNLPEPAYILSWNYTGRVSTSMIDYYELQTSDEANFKSTTSVLKSDILEYKIPIKEHKDKVAFYRLRIKAGNSIGPWSNTHRIDPLYLSSHTLEPDSDYQQEVLLAFHRDLIRFCAARANLFAVLSAPRHFKTTQILEYVSSLGTRSQGTAATSILSDLKELSYCAVYYPWVAFNRIATASANVPAHNSNVTHLPPDGAVIGSIAKTAIDNGAWIAPANIELIDVVALSKNITKEEWRQLFNARINVIRNESRGIVLWGSKTLSDINELGEINVRRLLILLRRLALKLGNNFVFENNSNLFRNAVLHHFNQLLSDLFIRGAFRGNNAKEAYSVVVDETVNPLSAIEQGKFVVDLKVAPSEPLKFLHVRLNQSDSGELIFTES